MSYKIAGAANFQDLGKTYAKDISVASDQLARFLAWDDERREREVQQLRAGFVQRFAHHKAILAAVNIYYDG